MTEVVEQDTIQSEDTLNILDFIRDGMPSQESCLQEGFLYNRRVFNGWMKQPSACCAAASVAGAFNALACLTRGSEGILTHSDILQIYESMFCDLIGKHKLDFERRLGAPIETLLVLLEADLNKVGKEIGGSKGSSPTKVSVSNCITRICRTRLMSCRVPDAEEISKGDSIGTIPGIPSEMVARDAVDCFLELYELEGISLLPEIPSADVTDTEDIEDPISSSIPEGAIDQEEDDKVDAEENEEEPDEDDVTIGVLRLQPGKIRPGKKGIKKDTALWDWRRDFFKIITNMAGLRKIRADRPSTAAIGNWGILQAVERLSEWTSLGTHLQARLFMGKKRAAAVKLDVPLTVKDDERAITMQWDGLRSAFAQTRTVLLFHLKNHYALIFALREWTCIDPGSDSRPDSATATEGVAGSEVLVSEVLANGSDSAVVGEGAEGAVIVGDDVKNKERAVVKPIRRVRRQILCARKGQRPTAWIDFEEARDTMLQWEGYKIIAVSYFGDFPCSALSGARVVVPEEYINVLQKETVPLPLPLSLPSETST